VIQTAWAGDVVLTTPLLGALIRQGPVDVLVTPTGASILEGHPGIRQVHAWDKTRERGPAALVRLGRRLRSVGYDRAVLPHRSLRSALAARLAGIPERIGFGGRLPALLYSRRVPWPAHLHETERLLTLAPDQGDSPPHAAVDLPLTAAERDGARAWLAARGIPSPFVALAPGAAWATKQWPGFGDLASGLTGPLVVIGSAAERDLAGGIAARAPGRVHSAAGETSLRQALALIGEAAVLVTNDSAPMHLATATGTPVVALFGPTSPDLGFAPRGPRDRILGVPGLGCRPCSPHGPRRCPLGHHRCMRSLPVDEVLRTVNAVLST